MRASNASRGVNLCYITINSITILGSIVARSHSTSARVQMRQENARPSINSKTSY